MASCHQVNCSGQEDADTVADGWSKLAATVLSGTTMELLF